MGKLLDSITSEKKKVGLRIFLYAPPKFGKSRWAAEIKDNLFLNLEDGLNAIPGVMSTPRIKTYEEFINYVGELMTSDHNFKTITIDTVDWLEVLMSDYVVRTYNRVKGTTYSTVAEIPFGQGYPMLVKLTRKLINGELEFLRTEKGMNIVCLAHSDRKTIIPPMGESYDYYAPKLYSKKDKDDTTVAAWKEWVDVLGFGYTKIYTKNSGEGLNERTQAVRTGDKLLYLDDANPAYLAGSRYKLPGAIPFTYQAFCEAMANALNPNNNETTEKGE